MARSVRGVEPLLAAEIERLRLGEIQAIGHREVRFAVPERGADVLALTIADDVFALAAEVGGVGRGRSGPDRLADAAAAADLDAVLRLRERCGGSPRYGGLDVSASFLGKRAYNRYDLEDAVGAVLAERLGASYHSRRGGARPPRGGLGWRVTVEGERAVLAVRIGERPLHRRAYKEASVAGTLHPPLAAAMAALAGPRPGQTALDPCCGAGTLPIEAARAVPGLRVLGLDADPAALAAATANASRALRGPTDAADQGRTGPTTTATDAPPDGPSAGRAIRSAAPRPALEAAHGSGGAEPFSCALTASAVRGPVPVTDDDRRPGGDGAAAGGAPAGGALLDRARGAGADRPTASADVRDSGDVDAGAAAPSAGPCHQYGGAPAVCSGVPVTGGGCQGVGAAGGGPGGRRNAGAGDAPRSGAGVDIGTAAGASAYGGPCAVGRSGGMPAADADGRADAPPTGGADRADAVARPGGSMPDAVRCGAAAGAGSDRPLGDARGAAVGGAAPASIGWGRADAGRLPVGDATVDRVLVNPPWQRQVAAAGALARHPRLLWRELRRVLAPGGRIVALVHEPERHAAAIAAAGLVVERELVVHLFGARPVVLCLREGVRRETRS
ncbi:putative RNA methylase family UPF0020 [Allonocardiopsis opalescens]|uniref:Putative RNA methylase family UPF0020 n=1 Tax=Allonocardiopsis opalescens TaxID=1144618 RepID=A0A2T0QE49_9ACTN|nr:putative RNA methylase family UPF0020 [Allonocardiopsis opalescens]